MWSKDRNDDEPPTIEEERDGQEKPPIQEDADDEAPGQGITSSSSFESNRIKAIVAMNLYAMCSIIFVLTCKVGVNDNKVAALDLILLVNCVSIPITFLIIVLSRDLSFIVPQ